MASSRALGPLCLVVLGCGREGAPDLEPLLGSAYIVTVAGDGVQTGDYLVFAETNSWCTLLDVCR